MVSEVEHRRDDYKSVTFKKQKRLRKRKKQRVYDNGDESTSSSDCESHNLSTMKWTPTINMKADVSHHSLIPRQNERVGNPSESIHHHHLEFERRNQSRHHHHYQSSQRLLKNPREGVIYQKRKLKKLQNSSRESFHLSEDYDCGQYNALKHEIQDDQKRRQMERFFKEEVKQSDISCHQSVTETIVISSGVSDSELNCSADTLKSVPGFLKASLPLSPHSDFEEELNDHELGKIIDQSVDKLGEMERYSPVSPPSSIKSPMDSCSYVQIQDISSAEVCHPAMTSNMEDVFPKEKAGDVNGNVGLNQKQETSPVLDQDTSDFEDVLSRSTLLALSQPAVPSSDEPEESDDELPEIDYFSAEVSETLLGSEAGNGPPLLGRYGQSPTPNDAQELQNQVRLSDAEVASSASWEADWEDSEDLESKSESAMNMQGIQNKTCTLMKKILPPNHILGKRRRHFQEKDKLRAFFTSYMLDLVEACHEEEFLSASMSLVQSFTTTKSVPPATTIHFLLKSILLEMSVSSNDALQAYKVLRHIHSLHPLSERTFDTEWEFLKDIVTSIVEAMTSFAISNEWTSQDRLILALQFMVSVFESVVFHEDESVDHPSTPVLERYMVRDVVSWLDVCMTTFDTWSSYAHQQFVHELITQLQKMLHFCCLQRFGNHKDYIATNLVHNFGHLSLPQKRHFLQTITCHELRQQLVERYLESNFEIPCCSLCKSNKTKVASTRQLSLQKLCNYHVHQRPLVVTQSIGDDDIMYYADEETGERIIIEPIQEVNSVRRHCTSCSQRIRLQPEHCEELVLLLLCLLQSLIQCPYPRDSGLNHTVSYGHPGGNTLHKDDGAVLAKLDEHIKTLTEDLLLSCSKLTVRTHLYLKEMSCLQRRL
ncbi:hypothetical protein HOLleu_34188 [Holothuria leucospilota]|uniref:Uncharacterized protein n=1 Tax=Holothuria leucospilota TaxID=206669 RepID=A0A9Q0YRK3_HOLLE|nr:hypothetical protein HOLleu_34188 [Holothuria leucospilota]